MKTAAVEGHYRRASNTKRKSSKGIFDDLVLYEARDCISRQKVNIIIVIYIFIKLILYIVI